MNHCIRLKLTVISVILSLFLFTSDGECKNERNPFAFSDNTKKQNNNKPAIEMILISNREACAVIGGKKYYVGDTIFNARITSINLTSIILYSPEGIKKVIINEHL